VLPTRWDTTITSGSAWPVFIACRDNNGQPMNLTGKTVELVIRPSTADTTQPPLIKVTTTPSAQGYVTVDTVAGTVAALVYATATALLTPNTTYAHALWTNPGLSDETALLEGDLFAAPIAAP